MRRRRTAPPSCGRRAHTPKITRRNLKISTTSPDQSPEPLRTCVDTVTAGSENIRLATDYAYARTCHLGDDIRREFARPKPAQHGIGGTDDRIEVRAPRPTR